MFIRGNRWESSDVATGGALRSFAQGHSCGFQLRPVAQQKYLVAGLEFFVRAGIDEIAGGPFDPDDARAGLSAELQFADELAYSG
jgi:hypothetical protein